MKNRKIYRALGIISVTLILGALILILGRDEAEKNSGYPPAQPTIVSAIPGVEQITLSWRPVQRAKSYNIYWSTDSPVSKSDNQKFTWNDNRYSHTGLHNGITYYYIITAVNEFGESPACEEVSGIPQSPSQASASETLPKVTTKDAPSTQQLEVEFHKELMERLMKSERPRGESPNIGEQTWFPEDEVPPPWDEWPDAGEPTWNPNEETPPPRNEWPGQGEKPKWSPHDEPQRSEAPF